MEIPDEGGRLEAVLDASIKAQRPHAQEMFLDIASILANQPVSRVLAAWSTLYANVDVLWENLISSSLISIVSIVVFSDEESIEVVAIHDVLRDLARQRIREAGNRSSWSRIWSPETEKMFMEENEVRIA